MQLTQRAALTTFKQKVSKVISDERPHLVTPRVGWMLSSAAGFKEAGEEGKGDGKEIKTSGLKPQTKIPGYITMAQVVGYWRGRPSVERRQ